MILLNINKITILLNKILTGFILIIASIYLQQVNAADGVMTMHGKVTAPTCTINAGSSENFSIDLPKVSSKLLTKTGATTAATPFAIHFSQCAAGSKVAAYFANGSTVDVQTGRLNNTASAEAASDVQIQLLNQDLQQIPLHYPVMTDLPLGGQQTSIDANGNAILHYALRYFSVGESTAGSVTSSINYMISYE